MAFSQSVKEPQLLEGKSWSFPVIWMVTNKYQCKNGDIPTPLCQLFQIHGSIFKPDPSRNGGQASVVCITHGVFLLRIRKDPLNGFFSLGVNSLAQVGLPDVLHDVQVFLPDMCGVYLLPLFIRTAFCFARAISALRRCASVRSFALPVGSGMS